MLFRERKNIVLEIQEKAIDILVGNKEKIDFEGSVELKEGLCVEGYIKNVEGIVDILNLYFGKHNINLKYISFVVFGGDIITRNIEVPYMKNNQFHKNIQFEIDELIENREEYYLDYEVIREIKNDYGKIVKCEVLIVGCSRKKIDLLVEVAESLGKEVDKIDVLTNTLNKILINSNVNYDNRNITMLYLGNNFSNISIANNGILKLERTIPFGINNILKELKGILEYENIDYEMFLKKIGKEDEYLKKLKENNPRILELINNFLDLVSKTMRFYNAGRGSNNIAEILVFSKVKLEEKICKYVEEYLSIKVRYIESPMDLGMKVRLQNEEEFKYLSLYGLLLRR
ncbi:MAG: pilus assembly protein PilM [Clostridium sp.]|uniref:pilus assembly protein PilM n=1 Tax=Clostridium sp. TaxID=1506 RepID=UPI003F352061